ncbi:hypothetical protein [Halobacillus sp. BBL2006]|uniref:hypothetical protein n=1 Tax=Halobacillus sp. BBL2006 TaxID=1543706 RepID=UPI0005438400|nr:hypothetical protein [Halobacillus sp. BBL2006]KHE71803.1 hypothetical protein LD39_07875 [Halobacillus sp. BBL2006]
MKFSTILALLSVLLLAGCLPQSKDVEVLSTQESSYELYLYMDQKEKAENYLSALLDWKTSQIEPEEIEFKQSKTNVDQTGLSEEQLPSIVIKKDGKVVKHITGDAPIEDILNELEQSIAMVQ